MSRFPSGVRFQTTYAHSSNYTNSSWAKNFIVLHWWDDPSRRPAFDGVVSWFRNPSANVSCQYVVEANRIAQMTPESAYAWHAGSTQGNRHGIGIEVNPRLNAGDYETTAVLVAEIWRRRGRKLPLRRHREFTSTGCPGHLDVARIQRRADQIYAGGSTPAGNTGNNNNSSGGTTVATPAQLWNHNIKSLVSGNNNMARTLVAAIHSHTHWLRNNLVQLTDRNTTSGTSHAVHIRRGDFQFRGLDYVNEKPTTKNAQIARAHQYAMDARREAREANAKLDALADVLSEAVSDSVREAFKAKIEDIKAESAKVQAADVAAELEVAVKDEEEDA